MDATTTRGYIAEMVRRIVGRFDPDQIILFGSHARGEADGASDVDLLVVMPIVGSPRDLRVRIRGEVRDIPVANDILVVSPEDLARRCDVVGTVFWPIVREGKSLYERPT